MVGDPSLLLSLFIDGEPLVGVYISLVFFRCLLLVLIVANPSLLFIVGNFSLVVIVGNPLLLFTFRWYPFVDVYISLISYLVGNRC